MSEVFKKADSILSVTLHKNQFSDAENSFIGHVTRNVVTLDNMIASISEKNEGVSPYMIQHVANLLGNEMLSSCRNGNAVDVLGMGTMYIGVSGCVSGERPGESSIPGFRLSFTPSPKVQEAVESLKVDKVVMADPNPVMDKIVNVFDQNEERRLMPGKGVRITGSRLKVIGRNSGIWFAPEDTEGKISKDEGSWIPVDTGTISCNKPRSLEFYVPDDIPAGKYGIVVRTRYCNSSKELKYPVTATSKAVQVS